VNNPYQEYVLDHYRLRYRNGDLKLFRGKGVLAGRSISVVCGDSISIKARISKGVITEILWQGEGCCFAESAASMVAQYAEHTSVKHMLEFTDSDMFELFQADFPKARAGCILVAIKALRELLEKYDAN